MFRLTIIHVGKLKSGPHQELVDGYLKRLSPYAQIEMVEVKEERFDSVRDRDRVLEKETERIRSVAPEGSRLVALEADGKQPDSPALAAWIQEMSEHETQHIVFVLGGPLGISDSLKRSADAMLSLSKQTYPHDLALVMLTEQLYRSMTILNNKTYHY